MTRCQARIASTATTLLLVIGVPSTGRSQNRALVNGCLPIVPAVSWLVENDRVDRNSLLRGGPTKDRMEAVIESRLRGARLYDRRATDTLHVIVSEVPGAFLVLLNLSQQEK